VKNKKDEKWLDEIISQAADIGKAKFDVEKWKRQYLSRSEVAVYKFNRYQNIWRFIMESKTTKCSAAAVIVIGGLLILFNLFAGSKGISGVAWADVERKAEEIQTAVIHGTRIFSSGPEAENGDEYKVIKYFSTKYGYVEEQYLGDNLVHRIYFHKPSRRGVGVVPPWKKYLASDLSEKQMEMMDKITSIIGLVRLFSTGEYYELGFDTIDGVKVEGFEIRDMRILPYVPSFIIDFNDVSMRMWVNVEDNLPVQMAGEFTLGKCLFTCFNECYLTEFNKFTEFNVELDPSIFEPNIPSDYTPICPDPILTIKAGLFGLGALPVGLIIWIGVKKRKNRRRNDGG
jgi:hypothetical protein